MRLTLFVVVAILASACSENSQPAAVPKPVQHAKINQFYASLPMIPKGLKGNLCYSVEYATKMELNPPVEDVWPALSRCFEVAPKQKTAYTLTAYGADGSKDSKTIQVTVGAPPPRVYDLWVNALEVHAGDAVQVCFKVENATQVRVSPGEYKDGNRCLFDHPKKSTTYRITALGGDRQEDTGTVTVKVR